MTLLLSSNLGCWKITEISLCRKISLPGVGAGAEGNSSTPTEYVTPPLFLPGPSLVDPGGAGRVGHAHWMGRTRRRSSCCLEAGRKEAASCASLVTNVGTEPAAGWCMVLGRGGRSLHVLSAATWSWRSRVFERHAVCSAASLLESGPRSWMCPM